MIYRLFGWWVRWQAVKAASRVIAGWNNGPDEGITPRLWSVTVFFEMYILGGSEATADDFGPKDAVNLHAVEKYRDGKP